MNYGFVINNRTCIGCHACSTACKSENEVPLGVHRTWVKTVETGHYPDSKRHFQVTRCNHCANPPCVRICPVTAMYQRDDGIVEFDSSVCIGCKACMQACPYDAIHIDPESNTAAKCHFCSHRVERGIEPACVVVCPEHAIIAGDLDDPNSEISRVLAAEKVTVRKPEQGTAPKLFYIEGNQVSLHPQAFENPPLFSEHTANTDFQQLRIAKSFNDPTTRIQPQGLPSTGPIFQSGKVAEHMVQQSYSVQHKVPWHWQVPAYLVTKGIAAGLFMLLIFLHQHLETLQIVWINGIALSMLIATSLLLIFDLERPERFYLILLRPQWRSWLTRGAVILTGFGIVLGGWWAMELMTHLDVVSTSTRDLTRMIAQYVGLPFAFGTAIYTAFLFSQAEGRDLWQSSQLPIHMGVQSLMVGAASMVLMTELLQVQGMAQEASLNLFQALLFVDLIIILVGELGMSHASDSAAKAAHEITHGHYAKLFWGGAIVIGHILPILFLVIGSPLLLITAAITCIVGLYCYEHAFVMAPQNIPNS